MEKKSLTYMIEGTEIEINAPSKKEFEERMNAYAIKGIRAYSGMSRKEFCEWLKIPYRTLQEWELGGRTMPDYVLNLIAYKVFAEKKSGRI